MFPCGDCVTEQESHVSSPFCCIFTLHPPLISLRSSRDVLQHTPTPMLVHWASEWEKYFPSTVRSRDTSCRTYASHSCIYKSKRRHGQRTCVLVTAWQLSWTRLETCSCSFSTLDLLIMFGCTSVFFCLKTHISLHRHSRKTQTWPEPPPWISRISASAVNLFSKPWLAAEEQC